MSNTKSVDITSDKANLNRFWVLLAACILGFMVNIDYSAVNVALANMSQELHSSLNTIQWVLSAYVLAWGAMVIPAGRLSDLYGKRRLFIIGNAIFILGSAMTGFATSAWFVIFSRVIQGIGGALFVPALYTLVFTAYPESERGKALGILTSSFAVGLAVGPTLGGILIHLASWRYIFFVNVPLGLIVIGIILKYVAKEPWKLLDEKLDVISAIALIGILVLFMFGVDQLKNTASIQFTLGIFVLDALFFAIFLWYERRQVHPILKISLFQNRTFIGCVLIYIFLGYNFAAVLIIGGLYLQNAMGYSPFDTGIIFLSMTIALGVLSIYGGRLCDYMPKYIPVMLGSLATAIAAFTFANLNLNSSLWTISFMFIMVGVGLGLAFPALNLAMMSCVKDEELNVASGTFTMFGAIGNAIGLILSAVSLVFFAKSYLMLLLKEAGLAISNTQKQSLLQIMSSAHYSEKALAAFPRKVTGILHESFIHAMNISVYIAMGFAIVSILLGLWLLRERAS